MKVSFLLCLLALTAIPAFAQQPTAPTVPVTYPRTYPPIYPDASKIDNSVRVTVGPEGGDDFDNFSFGVKTGVAVPIGNLRR